MILRNPDTAKKIRTCFDEKKILKQYLVITKYVPKILTGEIDIPLIRREVNGITKVNIFSIERYNLKKI